jgi:hypothetical protein
MAARRATITGHAARIAAYRLTDPRTIAANPPAPRAPTTSMAAPEPQAATARAGGPDSRLVVISRPGATSSARFTPVSSARADASRSALATLVGEAG